MLSAYPKRPALGKRRVWMPFDVPEHKVWLTAGAGTTDAGGGACSAWADVRSRGTRYASSQSTGSKRPTIAVSINSRATLDFAKVSVQELVNTTDDPIASGATRYVLAVVKKTATGNATGGTIFTFRINTTGGRVWALMYTKQGDGNTYYFTDAVSNNVIESVAASAPDVSTPILIEWELTLGATPVIRIQNVQRTLTGNLNATAELGTTGFRVGAGASSATPFDGSIADVFVAAPIPSDPDKSRLVNFFSASNGGIL